MAIYHTHISSGSRDDGHSAAVKVAYILREGAYGGRHDLVASGSGNMPAWASTDPRRLFEAADLYERANGRLFVHVWVALPNELNASQRHHLVLAIATALTEARLPYVYAIHAGDPKSEGEPANPHGHFVISERVNDGITRDERQWFKRANRRNPVAGGAAKDRSLKEVTWVEDTRKRVEELTNEHLCRAGRRERVTADSHAKRIAVAEAEGDQETAEYLRRHPPGIHLGPAAAAMERNRYRGKQGKEPELARPGEPTDRGNLVRAKAVEKERTRGELERVSKDLYRAREEERCATASVALARSVWLSDAEVLGVYKESESVEAGTGWVAITGAAALLVGRKDQAEALAESFGIDVEAVVRGAHARDENAVAAVEQATGIFQEAQLALMTNEMIVRIQAEAGSSDAVIGWGAVAEAARPRLAWKARTEAAARKAGIGDIDDIYTAARTREEDPLSALEAATAKREHQGRIASEARAALLTDAAIARIRREAEASEPGSGWAAVEAATVSRQAQKEAAEAGATTFGLDIEGVYAGAQAGGADPVVALGEKVAEEERLASERRAAIEQREGSVAATKQGRTWLLAAQREALDSSGRQLTLEQREKIVETVYQRLDEALGDREAALRSIPEASQYLPEVVGGAERLSTLAARESMVMTAEQRLGEELDDREERLVKSAGSDELLVEAFSEWCEHDTSFGDGSSLPERWRIITLAKQWHEEDLAEDAERSVALDDLEAMLKEMSSGAQHFAAAQQKVLGEGKEPATLNERESVVRMAVQAVEQELGRRETALVEQPDGSRVLREMKPAVGEDGAALSLVEHEKLLDGVERRLEEEAARRASEERQLLSKRGGRDLYFAVLTGLDPGWWDSGQTAVENIDAALAAAASDSDRLERLRDVLADPADVACYRAALAERGDRFAVADVDAAIEAVLRRRADLAEREEAARRRREEEEAARRREEEAARQQEEERQRRELAGREVAIRATSSGSQRLDAERRAKFGTTKRSLSVDEETSIVEVVELQVAEDLAQRETEVAARVGGTALLRAVPKRRGQASSGSLAEREETVMAVEQRLRAADAVEALLPATAPDPTRLDYRVPAVSNAVLDQAVTADDPLFVQDVVFLLRERYAHRAQDAENGYAAAARTASQQRYLGSALASALQWCVLKIREIILAACHKILGGRGEAGERVQALLASDGAVRQTYQRAAESAAEEVAIDVNAFYKAAASGRDQVAVLEQETARRQQVLAIAAGGMDRQAAHAAAEEESDDRLARLVGVYADAEQRSCYRAALGAEQVTLERVDAALDATATIVRRKEAIFDYPGNDQHPSGKALYTAGLRSLAPPDWRPGEDLPAGFPNQVLEDVESQLADRVQRASDAVEASVPTTQPYPNIKPDYRVPAVDDELLDLLVQEDDNAFFEATVVELRERYAQRARYDTPREERYTAADRSSSQQKYLGPSDAQARAQEKHRLHLREIISVACDATLGGDLGERLAQRRDLAQQVAAATEKKLPMVRPELHRPEYQVPAVFDQTLEHVAAASTNPVIQAAAAEVRVRYERRAGFDVPYKERYGPDDRRRAEWSHLRARVEIKHARAERLWLESRGSSPRPTREATEASVLNDHRSSILEAFEIAYDEVVGRGELGARLRKHREQIEFAADSVERDLQTMKSPRGYPVPSISDAELVERRAIADPVQQEIIDVVWDRMDSREHTSTPVEERYSAADRHRSEEDWLDESTRKTLADQGRELWQLSSNQRADARERALKNHRSRIRDIFETARDQAPVPTSDELVEAITKGPNACRSYRDLFAEWDVEHVVPYLVRNAIDPRLLDAVLGEQAARWVPQIEEEYARIRARYPDQFSAVVEPTWAAWREHWREFVAEETVPPGGSGPGGSGIGEGTGGSGSAPPPPGGSGSETPGGSGGGMPVQRPIQPGGHSDVRVPPPRPREKPHTGWQRSRTGPHVSRKR